MFPTCKKICIPALCLCLVANPLWTGKGTFDLLWSSLICSCDVHCVLAEAWKVTACFCQLACFFPLHQRKAFPRQGLLFQSGRQATWRRPGTYLQLPIVTWVRINCCCKPSYLGGCLFSHHNLVKSYMISGEMCESSHKN